MGGIGPLLMHDPPVSSLVLSRDVSEPDQTRIP